MSFEISYTNFSEDTLPILTLELIGYFSKDGNSQYHADLSQLKYYIPPSNPDNVCYNLDKNFTSTHHKSTSYCKLDDVLRWVSDNFCRLEKPLSIYEHRWLDVDFICRRGLLKTLLCSPYKKYDGWIICASKYHGTIYLCAYYTDEREARHVNATMTDKRVTSWGFKFEQYMVADHPCTLPNPSLSLNECEEFHCMFKAKFGDHLLLYGAEMDGIFSKEPITDTLIGKTNEFIELKTFPMYNENGDIRGTINPQRASECWSQNYLANINKLICGLKDKSATVRMIQEYPTNVIPMFSKFPCDVRKCKMFCKLFLDNVKRIVTKDHDKCMYKFCWNLSTRNVINYSEEVPDNETYFFLKSWFVSKAEEYRNASQQI